MTTSPPSSFPTSFDPAIHLHSEAPDNYHHTTALEEEEEDRDRYRDCDPVDPVSESFSDDLEALHEYRLEQARNKVVIRHRAWNLSDVFRSDEDIRPYTPTKSYRQCNTPATAATRTNVYSPLVFPSSPPLAKMPFMSSPTALPSRPHSPAELQKRKIEEEAAAQPAEPKRQKIVGGFVEEDDDDDNEVDNDELAAFRYEQFNTQFEQPIEQEQRDLGSPQSFLQSTLLTNSTSNSNTAATNASFPSRRPFGIVDIKTCSGKTHTIPVRAAKAPVPYERLVASRSTTAPGRAKKSYYGIEIHTLLDEAARDTKQSASFRQAESSPTTVQPSIESPTINGKARKSAAAMWTEKYRARKFTELIGDERTHRAVLRWLKAWDPIVFPNLAKSRPKKGGKDNDDEERPHRKVLLLCGPPGLGKTTLAHVCARQAGYEVLEINASDERSKDVVKGRIRDALGTENVKGMNVEVGNSRVRKAGRPVCVVVDEVDGVVSGSGGSGEGGFMKALIDLVLLDQKNAARTSEQQTKSDRKRKGDNFRFLRPLILVCNDVYHPSLRPLRASSVAEMVHVRKAPLENVVQRVKNIFSREGIACDNDGVRRLCEASWGLAGRRHGALKSGGTGEGDIRSVLVAAEWVAHKLRNESSSPAKLTKIWLEQKILSGSAEGSSFFKGLSRGGVREIVDRVFTEGAGFADAPVGIGSFNNDRLYGEDVGVPVGVADTRKRHAINRLREMVDSSGEHDRCIAECFTAYPVQAYQDDTFLSKPNAAYDWLHFHDSVSSKVFSAQDWELSAYLSQSVLAFHHLFASASGKNRVTEEKNDGAEDDDDEEHPFSGPKAEYAAFEAQKQNRAIVTGFQSSFSAPLIRLFRSTDCVVTDLIPNLMRILSPDVKPVVVRGSGEQRSVASVRKESERALVRLAVRVMAGMGVTFEKVRVETDGGGYGGWAYRMEPPLDTLVTFSKIKGTQLASASSSAPVRYAVRQVLDQEYRKETKRKQTGALSTSSSSSSITSKKSTKGSGQDDGNDKDDAVAITQNATATGVKRDFFGRIIKDAVPKASGSETGTGEENAVPRTEKNNKKVYVSFHEGFSNAVRKPISMSEFLAGL